MSEFLGRTYLVARFSATDTVTRKVVELHVLRKEYALDSNFRREYRSRLEVLSEMGRRYPQAGFAPVVDYCSAPFSEVTDRPYAAFELEGFISLLGIMESAGPLSDLATAEVILALLPSLRAADRERVAFHALLPEDISLGVNPDGTLKALITAMGLPSALLPDDEMRIALKGWYAPRVGIDSEQYSVSSDIYSIGALAYYLRTTGQYQAGLPSTVIYPLDSCLHDDPSQRPQSLDELEREISTKWGQGGAVRTRVAWSTILKQAYSMRPSVTTYKTQVDTDKQEAERIRRVRSLSLKKVVPSIGGGFLLVLAAVSSHLGRVFDKPKKVYAAGIIGLIVAIAAYVYFVLIPKEGVIEIHLMTTDGNRPVNGATVMVTATENGMPLKALFAKNNQKASEAAEISKNGKAAFRFRGRFDEMNLAISINHANFLDYSDTDIVVAGYIKSVRLDTLLRGNIKFRFKKIGLQSAYTNEEKIVVAVSVHQPENKLTASFKIDKEDMYPIKNKYTEMVKFDEEPHEIFFSVVDRSDVLISFQHGDFVIAPLSIPAACLGDVKTYMIAAKGKERPYAEEYTLHPGSEGYKDDTFYVDIIGTIDNKDTIIEERKKMVDGELNFKVSDAKWFWSATPRARLYKEPSHPSDDLWPIKRHSPNSKILVIDQSK